MNVITLGNEKNSGIGTILNPIGNKQQWNHDTDTKALIILKAERSGRMLIVVEVIFFDDDEKFWNAFDFV